jgi:hypothetical protein
MTARAGGHHRRREQGVRDDGLADRAAYAPDHLVKAMAALQSHTTTGANHPAMLAAATAFSDPRVEATW